MPIFVRRFVGPLVVLLVASVVRAQPAPVLTNSPPLYIQAGQSREVTLAGQNLTSPGSIVMADAQGLEAALINGDKPADNQVRVRLTAAPTALPGERELRVVTAAGVSNVAIVAVGTRPAFEEKEPNNAREQAREVQLPAEITGRIDGPGDVDQFRFIATRGQHLLFDARVGRIGSKLEPVIVICDAATGREIPAAIEQHERDPMLVFDVPADGSYVLEMRDLRYRGGADFTYRISAGAYPYLEAVLPMSAPRGAVAELTCVGHNLQGGEKLKVDLAQAPPGRMMVRAMTAAGPSNPVPFEVADAVASLGSTSAHTLSDAPTISLPGEAAGVIERPGDEAFFKFHVAQKRVVNVAILARSIGSPLDPLLSLRNAKGDVIDRNNGAAGVDAAIQRELEPGDYVASLRDVASGSGPHFLYRIVLRSGSNTGPLAVRLLPDVARIHRGGNTPLWFEVVRPPGFAGQITVQLEGLPAGVTCGPIPVTDPTSGLFSISAAADAASGSFPIRLKTVMVADGKTGSSYAEPESGGRRVRQAYLTVLDAVPFTIEPLLLTPERVAQLEQEVAALNAPPASSDPREAAAEAEWEKNLMAKPAWTVIEPATIAAAAGTTLNKQPDGSILASGSAPAKDTYTITAKTALKAITAFRLEALADASLPAHGPGAAANGNFVLDEFKVTQTIAGASPQPVALKTATADFSQAGFAVQNAIDGNPGTGWAIAPEFGKDHTAVFTTAAPAALDGQTTLSFVLEQQSPHVQHNLGRFRVSATTADPASLPHDSAPEAVLAILRAPREQRTPAQQEQVLAYYRANDPKAHAAQARLTSLQQVLAPWQELKQVEAKLGTATPALADEQAKWEQTPAAQAAPTPADVIAIVKTPAASRSDPRKAALAAHFRSIAPSLQPQRERAAQLRAQFDPNGVVAVRGKAAGIPITIVRQPNFKTDVEVTLEGFSAGIDPATHLPTPVAKNLKLTPLVLTGDVTTGLLSFTPEGGSEVGPRQVILRAAGKTGTDPVTQYSSAFRLTVNEK